MQLTPDSTIPTVESGTRHRTAERTGLQTGHPVIAVSHSMSIINLYFGGRRHVVADPPTILGRANQALATLQRYKFRLDEVARALSALEIEDFATLRDAMTVLQRLLMVRRIADELTSNVVELGTDGRLLGLQLDEMLSGTQGLQELLIRDYLPADQSPEPGRRHRRRTRRPRRGRPAGSDRGRAGARAVHLRRRAGRRRSARAATACWPGSPGCHRPCWTG